MKQFDVVVIGGGHAGCEASHAAARMGAHTALVTMTRATIGVMSCNPAIGGLGKGHLVREIDALDGVMGRVADASGIQFRLLNRRKGPAVQGPRVQSDRNVYKSEMLRRTEGVENLRVVEGEVVDISVVNNCVTSVILNDGSVLDTKTVVLTSGTFLNGVIHIGDIRRKGGRMGDKSSVRLAHRLRSFDLRMGRLKTGTPPRLDGKTIDWDVLDKQPADEDPVFFSFETRSPAMRQIACGITHTNEATHEIIRTNLNRSAMYGGAIDGVGPRYCPSIEDKVVRFSEKDSHQIFLEPEGLTTDTVYPNGISTSLPETVQEEYVRSIAGLENAHILQPGYAIEYDFVDPRVLDDRLSLPHAKGFFLAGQINGTTGYEEAAAQGLVAGLNAAACALERDPITFSRADSYIGVMVDDLTTRGVSEPYRMFTSRAEFRLSLRADNADQRLTPVGISVGCVSRSRAASFSEKLDRLKDSEKQLKSVFFTPLQAQEAGISVSQDGQKRSAYDLLAFPKVTPTKIRSLSKSLEIIDADTFLQLSREALYVNYIERQNRDIAAMKKDEEHILPRDMDYALIFGLSNELRQKLEAARPADLAQAARIDGMTPAALTLLLAKSRQFEKRKTG